MQRLRAFSEQIGFPLYFAIYFARLNTWTLVLYEAFKISGARLDISWIQAMRQNNVAILGDLTIGVATPIEMILEFRHLSDPLINNEDEVELEMTGFEITCNGVPLTSKEERRIVQRLLMFGNLEEDEQTRIEDGLVQSITFTYGSETVQSQGFEIVGSLSQLASRQYLYSTTTKDGTIEQILATTIPRSWGKLIPEGFKSEAFPIWQLALQPAD